MAPRSRTPRDGAGVESLRGASPAGSRVSGQLFSPRVAGLPPCPVEQPGAETQMCWFRHVVKSKYREPPVCQAQAKGGVCELAHPTAAGKTEASLSAVAVRLGPR